MLKLGILLVGLTLASGKSLQLNQDNFDHLIATSERPVLIDIYAPWCSHCRQIEQIWEELAGRLKDKIVVAKIDATENDALRQRFFIQGFPTIVLLKDGETRVYRGARTVTQMEEWALHGWEETKPVPFYKAPNSGFGRALGKVLGAPSSIWRFQKYLRETWHFSELGIALVFLAGPMLLGVGFIVFLDRMAVSSVRLDQQGQHQHQN